MSEDFIKKIERPKKLNRAERQQPSNIEQLLQQYDLSNQKIYDYLDELAEKLNEYITNE